MGTKNEGKGGGKRYKIWLVQANYDLEAAKISMQNEFNEWACYQAQQCVEKALKAVLVNAGWRAPKMHKLSVLMGFANNANEKFRQTKFNFRFLQAFTFISRYPFLLPGENSSPHDFIKKEDAEKCISQAKMFLQKVINLLEE